MQSETQFQQIIDRCFDDSAFRDDLLSLDEAKQRRALKDFFPDTPEGQENLDQALAALNRILDSQCRDSITVFFERTDPTFERIAV